MESFNLLLQLGSSALLGFAIGYTLKKALKIILILFGITFSVLRYIEFKGIISIHYEKLLLIPQKLLNDLNLGTFSSPYSFLSSSIPLIGGFIGGLIIGLIKG
jgi:uncharacterized membrane protein (Fun14 family)